MSERRRTGLVQVAEDEEVHFLRGDGRHGGRCSGASVKVDGEEVS